MATQSVSAGRGWHWLMQAINLGRKNPRAILGAMALFLVVTLCLSGVQMAVQYTLKLDPAPSLALSAVFAPLFAMLSALLIGGLLRVIHAAEHDEPTSAFAVFNTFHPGPRRNRLLGFGLVMMVIYAAVIGLIFGIFGRNLIAGYMRMLETMQAGGQPSPETLATMLPEMGSVLTLSVIFGLFLSGIYAIGFGQVAVAGMRIKDALLDGVSGTLKNLLPLIVLLLCSFALFLAAALAIGIVGGILAMIGGLISPIVGALLVIPIYLGMLLVMYMVMFGVMYAMWYDVCEDTRLSLPVGVDHIEI